MVLKTKLWVFLKQAQPKIIANRHVSKIYIVDGEKNPKKLEMLKQSEDKITKNLRNLFRPKKKVSKTELMILILIELKIYKDLFEQQEENCCKYVRVGNFYSKNYIKY